MEGCLKIKMVEDHCKRLLMEEEESLLYNIHVRSMECFM